MNTSSRKIEIYRQRSDDVEEKFEMCTEVTKVEKKPLLTLPNAHYDEIIQKFNHLKGINMVDRETKEVIISRTSTRPRIGVLGEPAAEYTKFGWTMMSPCKETYLSSIYLKKKTVIDDYDRLSRLDVLGIEDLASGDQDNAYSDFKEELRRSNEGWYETELL